MANQEIARRRTFAIIAHPDAGKTSLTEKLLLFGGQIQVAGAVKSNKIKKTATSDWMDIEKQRGISVTTSVMEFDYHDYKINILDTPGHQDFADRYLPHTDGGGQRYHRGGRCERCGNTDTQADGSLPHAQHSGDYLHQ
jgi:hypothetical protein